MLRRPKRIVAMTGAGFLALAGLYAADIYGIMSLGIPLAWWKVITIGAIGFMCCYALWKIDSRLEKIESQPVSIGAPSGNHVTTLEEQLKGIQRVIEERIPQIQTALERGIGGPRQAITRRESLRDQLMRIHGSLDQAGGSMASLEKKLAGAVEAKKKALVKDARSLEDEIRKYAKTIADRPTQGPEPNAVTIIVAAMNQISDQVHSDWERLFLKRADLIAERFKAHKIVPDGEFDRDLKTAGSKEAILRIADALGRFSARLEEMT